jgi:hypothetical protein
VASDAKLRTMREALVKSGGLDPEDLAEITTFRGYRRRADGDQSRELRIEILDHGDSSVASGAYRYTVTVTDFDTGEKVGRGNGGATIDEALAVFHSNELD